MYRVKMLTMWGGGGEEEVQTIVRGSERRRSTILYSTSKRDKIHSGTPQAVWVRSRVGANQSVDGRKQLEQMIVYKLRYMQTSVFIRFVHEVLRGVTEVFDLTV